MPTRASSVRPPIAGSTSATKPRITPARRRRRTRSAAAFALKPTAAPTSRQDKRPASRRSRRISPSISSIAAIISVPAGCALPRAPRPRHNLAMHADAALLAGLVAGLAIAMQVGAVSLLLIEASVLAGPRAGGAAGMGVATADFAYAAVAAAAGGVVGAALSEHESEIKIVAAVALAAIAVHGLAGLWREPELRALDAGGTPRSHFTRFLAITAVNPLTIASFAAVATALSLESTVATVAFVLGVGAASAGCHLLLTLAAGHAGRWITPEIRRVLAIGGRILVLLIAAHLLTS